MSEIFKPDLAKYMKSDFGGNHKIESSNALLEKETGRVVAVFYNDYDLDDVIKQLDAYEEPEIDFVCPKCGGHCWGTINATAPINEWIGHCNVCHNFEWNRSNDDLFFKKIK